MMDAPPIGSLRGPNLTSGKGGVVANYDIADWDHIVRHGIKPDGTPAVMPSEDYISMSDHELADIVALCSVVPAGQIGSAQADASKRTPKARCAR